MISETRKIVRMIKINTMISSYPFFFFLFEGNLIFPDRFVSLFLPRTQCILSEFHVKHYTLFCFLKDWGEREDTHIALLEREDRLKTTFSKGSLPLIGMHRRGWVLNNAWNLFPGIESRLITGSAQRQERAGINLNNFNPRIFIIPMTTMVPPLNMHVSLSALH